MNSVIFPEALKEVSNLVDGQWQRGSGSKIEVRSPYFGKTVGQVYSSTASDVNLAVEKAKVASQAWAAVPLKERCQVMFDFRENLKKNIHVLAQSVSLESGKTLAEAQAGVLKGIEVLEFALSLQNLDEGGKMEVSRGVFCEYRREPLGVVAGITPFNFPAMVPMWMIPIAITLGNSFIWKPSDKTPLTSQPLADALMKAGLPKGVFTVLQGNKETVDALLDHPKISAVGFVGSTPVAKYIYQRGSSSGKRVLALGGAKNHIILMPDADAEMAAKGITDSFTGCAGQRCMAASVLVAVGDCQPIINKIVEKSKQIQLGQDMGAIINKESCERLTRAVTLAEKEGVKVLVDGRTAKGSGTYGEGNWFGPTVLDGVKPGSQAATEELFGPIISIVRVNNLSEALEIENSNPYGNAASVFTNSGAVADRVAKEAKAGMVGVNIGVPVPREPFSFGGFYESKFGVGDITGPNSLDFWSNLKKVTTKWALSTDHNWMS